ncbi:MAG: hypothetical protein AB8H47_20775, partial [Bacteroidia bacterium]
MWCKSYWLFRALLLLLCLGFARLTAQNDCQTEKNYSISNFTINGAIQDFSVNDDNSAQISVGQANMGRSGSYAQGQSIQHGFWGHYLLQPQAPWLQASEGEHIDHVELRWEVVDDQSGPLVSNSLTKVYRNGRLLTTLPLAQNTYLDYNVFHDGDGNGQSVSLRSQEASNLSSAERDWQHFAMVHDSTHLFL